MCGLAATGFFFQWIYLESAKHNINIGHVKKTIGDLQTRAEDKLIEIDEFIIAERIDSLNWMLSEKLPFTYLIYKGDELIFWSDNQIEPQNIKSENWRCSTLSNCYALTKTKSIGDYQVVIIIPVKHNYPYENNELQNNFIPALNLNKGITIIQNAPADKYAIVGADGQYLFTLQLPEYPIYNESWSIISLVFFFLAYALMFYLFAHSPFLFNKSSLSWKYFFGISLAVGVFVMLSMVMNFPVTFFQNQIFTPYQYASSSVLPTLTHLSFLTMYFFSLTFLFVYFVKNPIGSRYLIIKKILLLLATPVTFIIVFYFLKDVVFNSTTEINISRFKDITFVAVWNHLLFLVWGVTFMQVFLKTHKILLKHNRLSDIIKTNAIIAIFTFVFCYFFFDDYGLQAAVFYVAMSVVLHLIYLLPWFAKNHRALIMWLFFFALFVAGISKEMNRSKKYEKFKIMAQNHYINENTEEDRIAISLMDDLNNEILNDKHLYQLVQNPDSILKANDYINNKYLRGFWNKYEMRLFGTMEHSEWDVEYEEEIQLWGKKVRNTHFYSMRNPKSDMTFLGAFKTSNSSNPNKKVNFYMEFYPRRTFKSYSFPNLLMENEPGIKNQLSLSSARYTYRELVSVSGTFNYKTDASWIDKRNDNFFVQQYNDHIHYIYVPDLYNYYVLSEEKEDGALVYLLYLFYTYALYLFISLLMIWSYNLAHKKRTIGYSFSSKYLISFIVLLILSFISIFYVSVNYMQNKYIQEQKYNLETMRNYIQMALQEKYYWKEDLNSSMTASLNFDLQDLSYIYHTDIQIYDLEGKLVGSSQPAIFTRGLISRLMSPSAYFSQVENINQYEQIGELKYLTAYADFYNGDFLRIGYIAVPQFFSGDMIKSDLEAFFTVIIHIYLFLIIIFIFLSLFINRQLSLPLTMLQQSLKEIKIGQVNKKISYKPKDEISQLVEQYNRTVDELEHSAQMLAKSERESAWKAMARQIAHEINNPLTPMKLTIQHLQYRKSKDDEHFDEYFDKSSATLIEQIENLSKIASSFSSFAKLPESNLKKVDVAKRLKSVFILFSNNTNGAKLYYQGAEDNVYAIADKEQLILVFNNLIKNALQAIPSTRKGRIDVILETTQSEIIIRINDNGKGIAPDVQEKLFTPNFTTKSTGMGLGLSISQSIIRMFGGKITFETKVNVGTEFRITLPRVN